MFTKTEQKKVVKAHMEYTEKTCANKPRQQHNFTSPEALKRVTMTQ